MSEKDDLIKMKKLCEKVLLSQPHNAALKEKLDIINSRLKSIEEGKKKEFISVKPDDLAHKGYFKARAWGLLKKSHKKPKSRYKTEYL